MSFNATITDSQQVRVTVTGAVDKRGNPAAIDGTPTFSSDDEAVCTFTADPDDATGMTGIIKAVGPLSTATAVHVTADVKLGPEVKEITENGFVEITVGEATGFSVTVGTPEEQPSAPAPAPAPPPPVEPPARKKEDFPAKKK